MRPSILLVDDKKENLLALEGILDGLGWDLCFASSGAEALRMLLTRDFAALVCDMHMPGMNGIELTRLVRSRERSRHAAILMLTASSGDSEELALAYAAGAVDFISKPVRPEVLIAKLRVFVELFEKTEQVRAQGEQLREVERRERLLELERIRQAGERRYQTLAHALPVIVWTADADGTPAYWNQRWYDYTGFRLDEGRTLSEALHPADREGYRIRWEKAIASGEPFEHEARLRRADGVYRWFLCRATPERGEAGVTAWIGTDTDIDDSRRIAAERETLLGERARRPRARRAGGAAARGVPPDRLARAAHPAHLALARARAARAGSGRRAPRRSTSGSRSRSARWCGSRSSSRGCSTSGGSRAAASSCGASGSSSPSWRARWSPASSRRSIAPAARSRSRSTRPRSATATRSGSTRCSRTCSPTRSSTARGSPSR